jgi:hypothetical protein
MKMKGLVIAVMVGIFLCGKACQAISNSAIDVSSNVSSLLYNTD